LEVSCYFVANTWLVTAILPFSELPPHEEEVAECRRKGVNLFFLNYLPITIVKRQIISKRLLLH
jgi:hypothetical protein